MKHWSVMKHWIKVQKLNKTYTEKEKPKLTSTSAKSSLSVGNRIWNWCEIYTASRVASSGYSATIKHNLTTYQCHPCSRINSNNDHKMCLSYTVRTVGQRICFGVVHLYATSCLQNSPITAQTSLLFNALRDLHILLIINQIILYLSETCPCKQACINA